MKFLGRWTACSLLVALVLVVCWAWTGVAWSTVSGAFWPPMPAPTLAGWAMFSILVGFVIAAWRHSRSH